jgi:putative DNA primase/helicase
VASLEESAVAAALFRMAEWGTLENWTLPASEMLDEVGREAGQRVRASAAWPKSPRAFTNELRRLAPLLRTRGISVMFSRSNGRRRITIDAAQGFGGDAEDAA